MPVSREHTIQEYLESIALKIHQGELTYETAPRSYRDRVGKELSKRMVARMAMQQSRKQNYRNDVLSFISDSQEDLEDG